MTHHLETGDLDPIIGESMNYSTRVLPPEEYPRLKGTEAEGLWPLLPPDSRVIVIEDASGEIVGCWTLFRPVHAECLWVSPEHRKKGGVFRRLLSGLYHQAAAMGARAIVTASRSDEVDLLLKNFGADELEGRHYTMTIPERFVCP